MRMRVVVAIPPKHLDVAERTLVGTAGHWQKRTVKLWLPPSERARLRGRDDAFWPEARIMVFESMHRDAVMPDALVALALRDVPFAARLALSESERNWELWVSPAPRADKCIHVSYTAAGTFAIPWMDTDPPTPDPQALADVSLAIAAERQMLRATSLEQEA